MGNKIIAYILGVLFIITFSMSVIGYINKDKISPNIPDIKSNIKVVNYSNETKDVVSLDKIIADYEFVKANKEFLSNYIKVYIENNHVKVDVLKSSIIPVEDEKKEYINYVISDVENPIAVQAHMSSNDGRRVKVYILDSYGRLFLSTFYADPSYNSTVTTYYYKVDNIESFSSLMIPLSNDGTVTENYTIFKTSDGTYYTDYNSGIEDIKILKINNIEPEVENTNES